MHRMHASRLLRRLCLCQTKSHCSAIWNICSSTDVSGGERSGDCVPVTMCPAPAFTPNLEVPAQMRTALFVATPDERVFEQMIA
jgi:hypothetical protein